MKINFAKSLLTLLFISSTLAFYSCGGTAKTEEAEIVYACPMHPETKGKDGDVCSSCGMALEKVEPLEENNESH